MNLAFARGSTGNVTEFSRCKYASNDDYRLQVEISDAYGDLLKCLHEICACDVAVKLEFEVMERQVRSPRPYGLMALLNEYGYNNDEQDQQRGRVRQEDRGRDRSRSRSRSPHRRGNADEHGEAEANEEQNVQDIIRAKFETRGNFNFYSYIFIVSTLLVFFVFTNFFVPCCWK